MLAKRLKIKKKDGKNEQIVHLSGLYFVSTQPGGVENRQCSMCNLSSSTFSFYYEKIIWSKWKPCTKAREGGKIEDGPRKRKSVFHSDEPSIACITKEETILFSNF